ncbi:hypothetical protein FACS189481_4080 [Clostridia bacterium]|nr:hypothetical protein FACS189481_4080 [Clostridia bacterium]
MCSTRETIFLSRVEVITGAEARITMESTAVTNTHLLDSYTVLNMNLYFSAIDLNLGMQPLKGHLPSLCYFIV